VKYIHWDNIVDCQVNGVRLENVTHQYAVDTFVSAGDVVTIVVLPGEEYEAAVWWF
jgi:hypothetical protein